MQVQTDVGMLEGLTLEGGGTAFLGVPFAQPPVGALRFEAPVPVAPWDGVRAATAVGADPIQPPREGGPLAALFSAEARFDEDCLYLNIWTPASARAAAEPKPVLVWIFGGGFEGGSANPPSAPSEVLAEELDCVVVCLTYRVGALGYLHTPGISDSAADSATNQGLQDQLEGLRWVKRNIAAFGGDPARITVGGISAGAFSIGSLLGLPEANGLFQQAILSSGSDQRIYPAAIAAELANDLLVAAGVQTLNELRALTAAEVFAAQGKVGTTDIGQRNLPGGKTWGVVEDGVVLERHPHESIAAGSASDVRLLIGTCREEANMWVVSQAATFAPADEAALLAEIEHSGRSDAPAVLAGYKAQLAGSGREDDLAALRALLLTDAIYSLPARAMADVHTEAGGTTYRYVFTDAPMGSMLGAFHAVDMLYFLRLLPLLGVSDPERLAVQDQLAAAFKAFIHTGEPGWKAHVVGDDTLHHIGP